MPTRTPQPGDPDFDWGTMDPNVVDKLLAEAHGSLDRANALSSETDSGRLAKLPASLAALRRPDDTRGPVRKFTEPLAQGGNAAMLAAIPAGVNPLIGGALLTGGGLATVPDYLRKMIAPEGDEERPGVVESGLTGLALLPAAGSLRGLKEIANPTADLMAGRALAYDGPSVARRGTSAIDRLMASSSFENLPRGNVSMASEQNMRRNPLTGEVFAGDSPTKVAFPPKSPFEQMSAAGEFGGDRSVRGVGNLETEGRGGLSDLIGGRITPNEMPWEPIDLPASTKKPLNPMDRLTARSKERFGRNFRRE